VICGLESGGSAGDAGRFVTFAGENGEPLDYLHPVEIIAVNGLHAAVIAPGILRADTRKGRTYELLITRHWLSSPTRRRKPRLESDILFRGIHGQLELDLNGKQKTRAGSVGPKFFSRAGEESVIPEKFLAFVRAVTLGVNCKGCTHAHYLHKFRPGSQSKFYGSVNQTLGAVTLPIRAR
jgi:hypothetical protein